MERQNKRDRNQITADARDKLKKLTKMCMKKLYRAMKYNLYTECWDHSMTVHFSKLRIVELKRVNFRVFKLKKSLKMQI